MKGTDGGSLERIWRTNQRCSTRGVHCSLKFLIIVGAFFPSQGGSSIFFTNLARILVSSHHEVDVVSLKSQGGAPRNECINNISIRRPPIFSKALIPFLGPLWIALLFLKERWMDVDRIIASNPDQVGIAFSILKKLIRVPPITYLVVGNFHEERDDYLRRFPEVIRKTIGTLYLSLASIAFGMCHHYLTSQEMKPVLVAYGVSPKSVVTDSFLGFVDQSRFFPRRREQDEEIVLYVGRMSRQAGVDVFLSVIPEVMKRRPATKFILIGGELTEDWQELVGTIPRENNQLQFLGEVDHAELPSIMARSTVVVIPRRYGAGLGLTALEAMAMGKAVILSETNRTVIEMHERFGCFATVPPGNQSMLADRLMRILEDNEFRFHLESSALRFVREHYEPEAYKEKLLNYLLGANKNQEI